MPLNSSRRYLGFQNLSGDLSGSRLLIRQSDCRDKDPGLNNFPSSVEYF
jgi:hypothetical protein